MDSVSVMRAATQAHKAGDLFEAERLYRDVLRLAPSNNTSAPSILLANVLLQSGDSARDEALALARSALVGVEARTPRERTLLHTRFGYFLLQLAGFVRLQDGSTGGAAAEEEEDGGGGAAVGAGEALAEAIRHLEAAGEGGAPDPLVARNLALAYTAAGRLADAERACATAVQAGGTWESHYKHAKALKRLGREAEALAKYCDAAEASGGHAMPMFWVRVAAAGEKGASERPAALSARVAALVSTFAASACAGEEAVPHEYIRKLFDGYSKTFDEHLVAKLGYATPGKLERLVVDVATAAGWAQPSWKRAADLGCGTGLAGVAFARHVRSFAGVDLSGGMVAEARKRRRDGGEILYDALDVGDITTWLRSRQDDAFDLLIAADVLVYIGDLQELFAAAARSMAPVTGSPPAPRYFAFSVEAPPPGSMAPFSLTGTGRTCHSAGYVTALAASNGFAVRAVQREVLRRNAGEDVVGSLVVLERV